jgi:DNA helicase HerA-like ATPase
MDSASMVVSSEGHDIDVLVKSEKIELGTILKIGDFYGIVAHMRYREDERIGSKQKLTARTQIFGRLDNGRLVRIKRPIEPYNEVSLAEERELEPLLSGEYNISIGTVYGTGARAFLDPAEYDRHMAILASTGAGKSYTAANLIKEFASLSLPVIVVDTHGEYQKLLSKLVEKTDMDIEVYTVKYPRKGYKELKIPVSNLEAEDFCHFTMLNEMQKSALGLILERLKGGDYELKDVIDHCDRLDKNVIHEETIKALKRRLISLERIFKGVFDRHGTDITKIVRPYQITIIDTSYASQGVRQSVVSYLAKELLQGRIKKENEMPDQIDYKLLFVVEEAHNYASSNLSHSCKYQLQRIASEGRKFGLGLCVISQKPSKIDEEILSQCNTGIYMHITNPNDKDHIKRSFEAINEEMVKDLDSLDVGECIIAGAMSRIPFLMCKVDRIPVERESKGMPQYEKPEKVEVGGFDYV